MELSLSHIRHIKSYSLPINTQHVTNGTDSGVYAFIHQYSSNVGIGSSIYFLSRLVDHLYSFDERREGTFLHQ